MAKAIESAFSRLNPRSDQLPTHPNDFSKAPFGKLFPKTDPAVDGEDCAHECETCSVELPSKWRIEENDKLYGEVNGWQTHLIVATGKTDWVRDVADEKGSVSKRDPFPKFYSTTCCMLTCAGQWKL